MVSKTVMHMSKIEWYDDCYIPTSKEVGHPIFVAWRMMDEVPDKINIDLMVIYNWPPIVKTHRAECVGRVTLHDWEDEGIKSESKAK